MTRLRAQEALVRALTDAARRFEHREDANGLNEQIAEETHRLARYEAESIPVPHDSPVDAPLQSALLPPEPTGARDDGVTRTTAAPAHAGNERH